MENQESRTTSDTQGQSGREIRIIGVEQVFFQDNYYNWLLRDESGIENLDISHLKIDKARHRFDRIALLGSCNGLVCARLNDDGTDIVLWNPTTKEFRHLPEPLSLVPKEENPSFNLIMGFGYDEHNKDYKLVRYEVGKNQAIGVQVFTQSSNSWRQLTGDYSVYGRASNKFVGPVSVNGALHWFACSGRSLGWVILSFNLHDEEFHELPALPLDRVSDTLGLANWKGSLVVLLNRDFWVMSDTQESWTKLFSINMPYKKFEPWLCGIWKDQLLVFDDEGRELLLYEHPVFSGESKSEGSKLLKKLDEVPNYVYFRFDVLDYVESQVSVYPIV